MSSVANRFRNTTVDSKDSPREKIDLVDFKMVTFSLAGKDYGIDIMKVKEIARFVNFTYVPNTPPFVRGVYNLRGEIISIIDFRALFNLTFHKKANNEEEPGLIVRLGNTLIGVVVDKIDKVVGINSGSIQPPHPIFGDINIKYISGVVENEGRLYIILDVDRVLGKPEEKKVSEVSLQSIVAPVKQESIEPEHHEQPAAVLPVPTEIDEKQARKFIAESLQALLGFTVSELNETWFDSRFKELSQSNPDVPLQVRSIDDAKAFMAGFDSPFSGQLWGPEYFNSVVASLPETFGPVIQVWNPGCGRGQETYSLLIALKSKYPDAQIKIWASDKDLLNISGAPNLVFPEREVPDFYQHYMTTGTSGLSFSQKIKESILFEYHDISNTHALPPMDLVFSRDVISFMTGEQQSRFIGEVLENLKKNGYLILGKNEAPPRNEMWESRKFSHMIVGRKV